MTEEQIDMRGFGRPGIVFRACGVDISIGRIRQDLLGHAAYDVICMAATTCQDDNALMGLAKSTVLDVLRHAPKDALLEDESEWMPASWLRPRPTGSDPSEPQIDIVLIRSTFYPGARYAVRQRGAVLNIDGQWEDEPLPSSRDAAFYERCRFKTFDGAVEAVDQWEGSDAG